jgi:aminoglycoside phosphotransferase
MDAKRLKRMNPDSAVARALLTKCAAVDDETRAARHGDACSPNAQAAYG